MTIRVLLADDQALLRSAFRVLVDSEPDMEVVGEASDGAEAVRLTKEERADVVLMDIRMPGTDGLAATRMISADPSLEHVRVVILTTFRGDANARDSMAAGAAGYLLKSALRDELLDCLRKVHAGGRYVSAEVCADVATHLGNELLTPRELRTLQLLFEGKENKRIASELGISIETVKSHVSRIFEKLGCHNRTEAIRIGIRRGLLGQMTQ